MSYKLFTFILFVKAHQRNSLVYKGLSYGSFLRWSNMKIDRKTFGRYMEELRSTGLLRKQGGHTEIESWRKCIEVLGLPINAKQFPNLLNKLKGVTFREALALVQEEVILLKLRNQKYRIDQNKRQLHNLSLGKIRSIRAAARKAKFDSLDEYIDSIKDKDMVVTGSRHISSVLGFTHETANKALNRLHEKGSLIRRVHTVRMFVGQVNYESLRIAKDMISSVHPTAIVYPSLKNNCIEAVLGSTIVLK